MKVAKKLFSVLVQYEEGITLYVLRVGSGDLKIKRRKWNSNFLLRLVSDLPHVVCDELRVVELVVPVGGSAIQVVVVFVFAHVLQSSVTQ